MTDRNTYDDFAEQYSAMVSDVDVSRDPVLSVFLDLVGDVQGLRVLDAGCGDGLIARLLASRGAQVCAVDICAPLVELGRSKDLENAINYRVHDLSTPLPDLENSFDLVASHLVLNDVPDYVGFVRTLSTVCRDGGRAVLSMNNPYSAVPREKVPGYFATGESVIYQGMVQAGVEVYYYHRTMEEYIDVFRKHGFLLRALKDISPDDDALNREHWNTIPFLMVLEFVKPHP